MSLTVANAVVILVNVIRLIGSELRYLCYKDLTNSFENVFEKDFRIHSRLIGHVCAPVQSLCNRAPKSHLIMTLFFKKTS